MIDRATPTQSLVLRALSFWQLPLLQAFTFTQHPDLDGERPVNLIT